MERNLSAQLFGKLDLRLVSRRSLSLLTTRNNRGCDVVGEFTRVIVIGAKFSKTAPGRWDSRSSRSMPSMRWPIQRRRTSCAFLVDRRFSSKIVPNTIWALNEFDNFGVDTNWRLSTWWLTEFYVKITRSDRTSDPAACLRWNRYFRVFDVERWPSKQMKMSIQNRHRIFSSEWMHTFYMSSQLTSFCFSCDLPNDKFLKRYLVL